MLSSTIIIFYSGEDLDMRHQMSKLLRFIKIVLNDLYKKVIIPIIKTIIVVTVTGFCVFLAYLLLASFTSNINELMLLCFSCMVFIATLGAGYGIFKLYKYLYICWLSSDD